MSAIGDSHRIVYLPLEKLDECSQCAGRSTLRLCSSCNERIYCGAECQKLDWPSHKVSCGKTDKIDLTSFYPLLACLVEKSHNHPAKPVHLALLHQIVNNPTPDCHPTSFDGWVSKLVILDDQISSSPGTENWWPAANPMVRCKLLRRIFREGYVLPIVTAVCIALLAEMYTTTSGISAAGDHKQRRVRLRYRSSPIADFGIAVGSTRVTNQDKLAYFRLSDGTFIRGQDPEHHYWIYFTTVRGEEIVLDTAMFNFNLCLIVDTEVYLPQLAPHSSFAPAVFRDRSIREDALELHTERKRISVLRNEAFHRAVMHSTEEFSEADMHVFYRFMEELSGKACTQKEKELLGNFARNNCNVIGDTLDDRRWIAFPSTPAISTEQDPGESVCNPDDGSEEWFKYMKKWKKLKKSGKAGDETMVQAFQAWKDRWSESKKNTGRG